MNRSSILLTCVAVVAAALLSNLHAQPRSGSAGDRGNPNPEILPPHATHLGKTAAEWTVAWW